MIKKYMIKKYSWKYLKLKNISNYYYWISGGIVDNAFRAQFNKYF